MDQKPMTVTLNYHNRSLTDPVTLVMISVVYSEDNRLKYLNSSEETIGSDELITFESPMTIDLVEGDYAKVFLWTLDNVPVRETFRFD
jgi:hypothetical protein